MYIVLGVVSERMDTTRRREVGVGAIQSRWRVRKRESEDDEMQNGGRALGGRGAQGRGKTRKVAWRMEKERGAWW